MKAPKHCKKWMEFKHVLVGYKVWLYFQCRVCGELKEVQSRL